MARPKKSEEKDALSRLEESFWNLLEKYPYNMITIKLLTAEARINHNTFYYHFRNIDEMAVRFFYNAVDDELLPDFRDHLKGFLSRIEDKDSDSYRCWRRVSLFTCRESDFLISVFKSAMRDRWNRYNSNICLEETDRSNLYLLDFIESGLVDLIAKSRINDSLEPLYNFSSSPFERAIVEILDTWE